MSCQRSVEKWLKFTLTTFCVFMLQLYMCFKTTFSYLVCPLALVDSCQETTHLTFHMMKHPISRQTTHAEKQKVSKHSNWKSFMVLQQLFSMCKAMNYCFLTYIVFVQCWSSWKQSAFQVSLAHRLIKNRLNVCWDETSHVQSLSSIIFVIRWPLIKEVCCLTVQLQPQQSQKMVVWIYECLVDHSEKMFNGGVKYFYHSYRQDHQLQTASTESFFRTFRHGSPPKFSGVTCTEQASLPTQFCK